MSTQSRVTILNESSVGKLKVIISRDDTSSTSYYNVEVSSPGHLFCHNEFELLRDASTHYHSIVTLLKGVATFYAWEAAQAVTNAITNKG